LRYDVRARLDRAHFDALHRLRCPWPAESAPPWRVGRSFFAAMPSTWIPYGIHLESAAPCVIYDVFPPSLRAAEAPRPLRPKAFAALYNP
jgi:hypothetical protein